MGDRMNRLRNIAILVALCLSLAFSQVAIGASLETVKKDMGIISENFIANAESSGIQGSLQLTDIIKEGTTTWYLTVIFEYKHASMIYIQEEITVDDGKVLYFDGITFNRTTYKWVEDCYAYHIDKEGSKLTYLKKDYIRSWERGIEKFKDKYRL